MLTAPVDLYLSFLTFFYLIIILFGRLIRWWVLSTLLVNSNLNAESIIILNVHIFKKIIIYISKSNSISTYRTNVTYTMEHSSFFTFFLHFPFRFSNFDLEFLQYSIALKRFLFFICCFVVIFLITDHSTIPYTFECFFLSCLFVRLPLDMLTGLRPFSNFILRNLTVLPSFLRAALFLLFV